MPVQLTTDGLGTALAEATFVVVDLETTGGAPADGGITEFGAVRIRGGDVIGEFATLVNPGMPIPPFVVALTGITDALVMQAPRLEAVLPAFLEFLGDAILIAHNAPYDVGFLKGACARHGHRWPTPMVLDTARIARVALHRDEVRNCKLATLAAHFQAAVSPTHRALDDARATVDVFHALVARVGDLGVHTVEDLQAFSSNVTATQRRKRHLAADLPDAPGVYVFEDAAGVPLYVGTSKHIRTRVRGYFTASETRTRMAEMIGIAARVRPIVCATPLEARVRELRLIAETAPRYNHRSKRPDRQAWLKLTAEPAPRLSVTREVKDDVADGARYLGPFPGSSGALATADAIGAAFGLRTCTTRIAQRPRATQPQCALAELGRCLAPCSSTGDRDGYLERVAGAQRAMSGHASEVVTVASNRMHALADDGRFEEAAMWRDRLASYTQASARFQRLQLLGRTAEIIAAAPTADGGWEVHCIRFGRLAGAASVARGADPRPVIDSLVDTAHVVMPTVTGLPAALTEEAEAIESWLATARLVAVSQPLVLPIDAGAAQSLQLQRVRSAARHVPTGDYQWMSAYANANEGRPTGPREAAVSRIQIA